MRVPAAKLGNAIKSYAAGHRQFAKFQRAVLQAKIIVRLRRDFQRVGGVEKSGGELKRAERTVRTKLVRRGGAVREIPDHIQTHHAGRVKKRAV